MCTGHLCGRDGFQRCRKREQYLFLSSASPQLTEPSDNPLPDGQDWQPVLRNTKPAQLASKEVTEKANFKL